MLSQTVTCVGAEVRGVPLLVSVNVVFTPSIVPESMPSNGTTVDPPPPPPTGPTR